MRISRLYDIIARCEVVNRKPKNVEIEAFQEQQQMK